MSTTPLRLAIVGCGRVVERYHLPALAALPELALVAAVERDPVRRAWLEQRLPGCLVTADLEAALERARPEAAMIATPPASHADLAARCLAAGLAVLVEKPLATRPAAAEALLAAAAAGGQVLATGFNRRFRPSWQAARRALATRGPVPPADARLTLISDAARWGLILDDRARALTTLLDDIVPHQVDLLAWLLDRPIERVEAGAVGFDGRALSFDFRVGLAGGPLVGCRAGYGRRHVERFEAGIGGRTLLADPAGAIALRTGAGLARALSAPLARAADLLDRLSGRPSASQRSFAAQHTAFARAVGGRSSPDLADGLAGVRAAYAVEALRASLDAGRSVGLCALGEEP